MASVKPTHRWNLPSGPAGDLTALARAAGVPELVVSLLQHRGLTGLDDIKAFLEPNPAALRKPDLLPDIARATERITAALERRERILVYGDYDVDGVTGTALLVSVLAQLGADVSCYLPARETEGYGFSLKGAEHCRENGVRLVITNDCGTGDRTALAAARDAGIDVIVTDHHELKAGAEPLPAFAFVNPKRPDSAYPFRELAGVGVAFKLAWSVLAALGRPKSELTSLLDLVGLGTMADVVPLVDENRVIARLGLSAIRHSPRPGIRALVEVARLKGRSLASHEIGFMLAPRINAAGRVGRAEQAVRLLLSSDEATARQIAAELDGLNRQRQALEEEIFSQAIEKVNARRLAERRALVVAGSGWHEGVIGIVAARLVEEFYRPSIVVALKGDRGKGSGRSIAGFNLHQALEHCAAHLVGFGGHRYAAGLVVEPYKLPRFEQALIEYADQLPEDVYQPSLQVEAVAHLDEIDRDLMAALDRFEPFGPDNPPPLFASLGLEVVGYPRRVGKDHLKFRVRSGERVLEAIAWGRSRELLNLRIGEKNHLDICYTVGRRTYADKTSIQLTIRDLATSA
jgi:single-stranded-DNA-specific exonuclease